MPQSFVFLEITDPEINGILHVIRSIANRRESRSNIHVTLRGPYDEPVPVSQLKRITQELARGDLLLANPGMFENGPEFVTYLRVTHKYLRSVSWKRDFPVSRYGFNPHISLYVGPDRERANRLLSFLEGERLELLCREFLVTTYRQKELTLFDVPEEPQYFFPGLIKSGKVRVDFPMRLKRVLDAPQS